MKIGRVLNQNGEMVTVVERAGHLDQATGDILTGRLTVSDKVIQPTRWLSPIEPRAIFCIGLNYRKHAQEGGKDIPEQPVVFMKNPAAALGCYDTIILPKVCADEVDYECELAVVIGRTCRDISLDEALDCVAGYMPANDVSARIWQSQRGGGQWVRGKSFDTFAPMGPFLVTADEIDDPNTLRLSTTLNGVTVQDSNTSDMIFSVRQLIAFLTQGTTLLPGTVILTGTPQGVGWCRDPKRLLHPGDIVSVEVESLGRLENHVAAS